MFIPLYRKGIMLKLNRYIKFFINKNMNNMYNMLRIFDITEYKKSYIAYFILNYLIQQ